MKTLLLIVFLVVSLQNFAQQSGNCFLEDFEPITAVIPVSDSSEKLTQKPTVTVSVIDDTIAPISKYIFGNAIASWMGNNTGSPVFVKHVQELNPSLIRFPGGSWGDIFFFNGRPGDLPDSLIDGTNGKKTKFFSISGVGEWSTTTDNYYKLREQTGSQGLITINYGYARYGLGEKPVEQAAHLAADWVRYDNGRTKFWEIGNENGGPWEAGWMIDTATNKDGQPQIITGQLYGSHFKVFADSMRNAATQVGAQIYIGGQVLHFDGTNSWNSVDRTWNSGFLNEVGDTADFYVMHNYFGSDATVLNMVSVALNEPKKNINFINQDVTNKGGFRKPVALTEYNMNYISSNPTMGTSYINGIQAVILFNELIKNRFGLSARWLLASGESGMFYQGSNSNLLWQPRPDFYYAYFTQKFTGDHMIKTSSDNPDILAYASRFGSGETGVILVNKGRTEKVVEVYPGDIGIGDKYYCYSLTGGTDNGDFSQYVSVNNVAPTGTLWGPAGDPATIPAKSFTIGNEISLSCPGLSVQFIMLDAGNTLIDTTTVITDTNTTDTTTVDTTTTNIREQTRLINLYNYPNPFSQSTTIQFETSSHSRVVLDVFDQTGKRITELANEVMPPGVHSLQFNGNSLSGGVYYYTLKTGNITLTRKMILIK
jgi:hypothetical protein